MSGFVSEQRALCYDMERKMTERLADDEAHMQTAV